MARFIILFLVVMFSGCAADYVRFEKDTSFMISGTHVKNIELRYKYKQRDELLDLLHAKDGTYSFILPAARWAGMTFVDYPKKENEYLLFVVNGKEQKMMTVHDYFKLKKCCGGVYVIEFNGMQ